MYHASESMYTVLFLRELTISCVGWKEFKWNKIIQGVKLCVNNKLTILWRSVLKQLSRCCMVSLFHAGDPSQGVCPEEELWQPGVDDPRPHPARGHGSPGALHPVQHPEEADDCQGVC